MSRVNDVGGQSGFGPVAVEPDEPPFHADWEARVYALNVAMLRQGVYNLDQFRDAVERMPPADVLNGIAYDKATRRIYITGKKWPRLYQITVS